MPTWQAPPRGPSDAVVARVAGVAIHASEVQRQAAAAGKPPRAALDDLIALELLAQQARALGWASDARARHDVKHAKLQRWLETEFEARHRPQDLPDATLRPFYDKAVDIFVHPRIVHGAALTLYAFPHLGPQRREEARRYAAELMAVLAKRPDKSPEDFAAVAALPEWKERRLHHTKPWQGLDKPMSRTVGEAVAKLLNVGDTTPLIEDENGFHVIRYISERSQRNESFEVARHKMREEYADTWRKEQFTGLGNELMTKTGTTAYFDRVFRRDLLDGS